MLNLYCSTKVNRPVGAAAKLLGYLKSSKSKNPANKRWLVVILCLAVVFPAGEVLVPQTARADDGGYLLDKVIEWPDGSIEHVQIGKDGFFRLDGVKRRLVGMCIYTYEMPYGDTGQCWLPENLAIYDKVLAYLESAGVRLIHFDMRYIRWWVPSMPAEAGPPYNSLVEERQAYEAILDLMYQHNMLVIVELAGKWQPNFGSLKTLDFSWAAWYQTDTMGAWAGRWIDVVAQYPNVVAVRAEDELDYPLSADMGIEPAEDQEYGLREASDYLDFLLDIIRPKIDAVVIHSLTDDLKDNPDIKSMCLDKIDHPSFNCHHNSPEELTSRLHTLLPWLEQEGYPGTGWWCTEMSKAYPPDNADFTVDFIETVFDHGASLVTLFEANNEHEEYNRWAFFDSSGDPKPQMVKVAQDIGRLQVPESVMLAQQ